MKKIICMMLAVAFVLSFAACGKQEVAYEAGTCTDTTYTSTFEGLTYTITSGMTMATKDQLDQMITAGAEYAYEDDAQKVIDYAKTKTVYEMMAYAEDGGNVLIMTEKVPFTITDEGAYIDSYRDALETAGLTVTYDGDPKDAEIAGAKYRELNYAMEISGVTVLQSAYFRKIGDRVVVISLTYFSEGGKAALMSGFAPLK